MIYTIISKIDSRRCQEDLFKLILYIALFLVSLHNIQGLTPHELKYQTIYIISSCSRGAGVLE